MAIDYERETAQEIYKWLSSLRKTLSEEKDHEVRRSQNAVEDKHSEYHNGVVTGFTIALDELREVFERIEDTYLKEDPEGESLADEEEREYWKNVLNDELRRNR